MGANSQTAISRKGSPSGNAGILTADGNVLAANTRRNWWGIQNLNTTVVFVKFGAGATTTDYDICLKAGTAADDGTGGAFFDDTYQGIVSVKAASGAPRVHVTEQFDLYPTT